MFYIAGGKNNIAWKPGETEEPQNVPIQKNRT